MKAVIIGNGMVGQELAKTFLENGYEVSIIDKDKEIIQEITNKYDITGIVGDGISKTIQIKAGIDYCDVAVILTSDNATNILAGIEAKKNGAKYVIVRVKNFSEKKDLEDLRKTYGIDLILDSIDYGAEYISQMIRIPSIIKQVFFASKNNQILHEWKCLHVATCFLLQTLPPFQHRQAICPRQDDLLLEGLVQRCPVGVCLQVHSVCTTIAKCVVERLFCNLIATTATPKVSTTNKPLHST